MVVGLVDSICHAQMHTKNRQTDTRLTLKHLRHVLKTWACTATAARRRQRAADNMLTHRLVAAHMYTGSYCGDGDR